MKKLLFLVFICFAFISCDSYVKECSYEVYQRGERMSTYYTKYVRLSETCSDFTEGGTVYILSTVKEVRYDEILQ